MTAVILFPGAFLFLGLLILFCFVPDRRWGD